MGSPKMTDPCFLLFMMISADDLLITCTTYRGHFTWFASTQARSTASASTCGMKNNKLLISEHKLLNARESVIFDIFPDLSYLLLIATWEFNQFVQSKENSMYEASTLVIAHILNTNIRYYGLHGEITRVSMFVVVLYHLRVGNTT